MSGFLSVLQMVDKWSQRTRLSRKIDDIDNQWRNYGIIVTQLRNRNVAQEKEMELETERKTTSRRYASSLLDLKLQTFIFVFKTRNRWMKSLKVL